MDEGKLIADFLAANAESIYRLGKKASGKLDESIKLKLKTAYTAYLKNSYKKYSKAKSFFIRDESVDLYAYYVPTGIRCDSTTINPPSAESCTSHSKRIVIKGSGGSGKSVLMRHLFLDCIQEKKYVPIMIELRDLNTDGATLESLVKENLEDYGFEMSAEFYLAAKKAGHFCFFLDGYDEVNQSSRVELLNQLKKLSNKFPDCPIYISSRPDDVFNGIESYSIFNIMPLDLLSAVKLIYKLPFDESIKKKFIKSLQEGLFEQHSSFLSNPLLLSIMLLTYGENAEIPSKLSVFYNQAYEALFQRHDANKGGYRRKRLTNLDIQDFSRVFSLFSLQTYDRRIFKMSRTECLGYISKAKERLDFNFNAENYLSDSLSAACLLIEDGLEIAFSHRSFQEYFVALHISKATPETQEKLLDRYWRNISSDNVIYLLTEIDPELVERVLLLPTLEKLFTDIGVKKKIGITHATKFIKRYYTSIKLGEKSLTIALNLDTASEEALIYLAVKLCKTFEPHLTGAPESENANERKKAISEYWPEGDKKVPYDTQKLTYKSPLIVAMLEQHAGILSLQRIQAVYSAYMKLKTKYSNSTSDLYDFLGI